MIIICGWAFRPSNEDVPCQSIPVVRLRFAFPRASRFVQIVAFNSQVVLGRKGQISGLDPPVSADFIFFILQGSTRRLRFVRFFRVRTFLDD